MNVRVTIEVDGQRPVTVAAHEARPSSVQPRERGDFEIAVRTVGRDGVESAVAIGVRRDLDPVLWARELTTVVALERERRDV